MQLANNLFRVSKRHKQQGSVLLWGLVILITLTLIGVAAARMSLTDNRIAANQSFHMQTYQGAESALERVTTLFNIKQTVDTATNVQSWNFTDEITDIKDNVVAQVNSTGTISMQGGLMCTGQEGFSMSIEMNPEVGGVACRMFSIDSRARLAGTGARSLHAQGVLKYAPATGDSP